MSKIHRAWFVAFATFAVLLAAASFRSTTGVLLESIEAEFGWSRSVTAGAVSLNLMLYGLTAPFAAAFLQRFTLPQVVSFALGFVALGSGSSLLITQAWQLWATWGLCIGFGTGSLGVVFGAIVANRWFAVRRSLVTGIFSAASATGQLIFLPLFAALSQNSGWRSATSVTFVLSLILIPVVLLLMRDRPSNLGLLPYGASTDYLEPEVQRLSVGKAATSSLTLLWAARKTFAFWLLVWSFFVCGWSTNGLIQTHFVPAAHDHGMPATTAAGLLAFVGIFDLVGTIASGWLTDRANPRYLLFGYYSLRGIALCSLPYVLGESVKPPLLFFIVFYGLDWVATVPPTVQLCRESFGLEKSGVIYGWVFASHMVGAGISASVAGWIRTDYGDYRLAWLIAAVLCVSAAIAALRVPKGRAKAFVS